MVLIRYACTLFTVNDVCVWQNPLKVIYTSSFIWNPLLACFCHFFNVKNLHVLASCILLWKCLEIFYNEARSISEGYIGGKD